MFNSAKCSPFKEMQLISAFPYILFGKEEEGDENGFCFAARLVFLIYI